MPLRSPEIFEEILIENKNDDIENITFKRNKGGERPKPQFLMIKSEKQRTETTKIDLNDIDDYTDSESEVKVKIIPKVFLFFH